MCGIFGYILKNSRRDPTSLLEKGVKDLNSRGPDFTNSIKKNFLSFEVAIAHTRLSIIDLSESSNQPMVDNNSKWIITYNGEIYNYLEIRNELEELGHQFYSSGDTEVLLRAWIVWGEKCLNKLNGMFSFGAYNSETGELWLVRDRFGVKPLFWIIDNDKNLFFSSSAKSLAEIHDSKINFSYCSRGLKYKVFETLNSQSPYSEINAVESGSFIKFRIMSNQIITEEYKWYDLNEAVNQQVAIINELSEHEVIEKFYNLIYDATRIRLRSDVPFATSLSGGIDSSIITSFASKETANLHSFHYGHPENKFSEGPLVDDLVKFLGIKNEYIFPEMSKDNLNDLLDKTLLSQEAPFSGVTTLAQNLVYQRVSKMGFKVLLGGQGGDEVLAGYRKFFLVALKESFEKRDYLSGINNLISIFLMIFSELPNLNTYISNLDRYFGKNMNSFKILNWNSEELNLLGESKSLMKRQIEDIELWSIPTLLRTEDRNSMGNSVESRLPFMDYRLVEFGLALPSYLKIKNGHNKWILRKASKNLITEKIRLARYKRGFDVSQDWVNNGLGEVLRSRIFGKIDFLKPHLKNNLNLDELMSNKNLSKDERLLDECLMLAWLSH